MQLSDYDAFPTTLPFVVEDEMFLYPFMISPIFLSHQEDIDAINEAMENNSLLFVATSIKGKENDRSFEAIHEVGVVGSIMRKVHIPDGRIKILFQGLSRAKIVMPAVSQGSRKAIIDTIEIEPFNELKVNALMDILRGKIKNLSSINSSFSGDLVRVIEENEDPNRMADLVSSMLKLEKEIAYRLYIETDIEKRLLGVIDVITSQIEAAKIQKEIRSKVHSKIEQNNKEYFLKEQLKEIQHELGVDTQREEEIALFKEKIEVLKPHMGEDAFKETQKQLNRFSRVHPDSADANTLQTYLEWVLDVPFGKITSQNLSIKKVSDELDKDHYSLKKPKERILEFFSVRELAQLRGIKPKEAGGEILCFAGPPGVGKTSLANSIATALGRPLVRIALGGLEDVNELRGHRRTYVGAMPGRLVQGLVEAKSMDPVIVLDEIDKVGRSSRGDPTAALLEILDPEQNVKYRDHYLNFHIDLSKVIFIATANDVGHIPAPLRDRMEFITLSSYTPKEKFEIAKRYLIPQETHKHVLKKNEVSIFDDTLKLLIEEYTREAGVRNLRRRIAGIMRKSAREILEKELEHIDITTENLKNYVDKKVFEIAAIESKPQIGIVNGLAWTPVGGDVLRIEAIKINGKGAMQLTGKLGDVMKESVHIAHSVVKILIDNNIIKITSSMIPHTPKELEERVTLEHSEVYKRFDLHVHVPEGATPKDGPSAGIAMVTAIASILSESKIDNTIAMTGEVTLTGKVLPIGGLKEKLIAAYNAGIKKALIPLKNYERDLMDIPDEVKEHIQIIPVEYIAQVLEEAFIKEG